MVHLQQRSPCVETGMPLLAAHLPMQVDLCVVRPALPAYVCYALAARVDDHVFVHVEQGYVVVPGAGPHVQQRMRVDLRVPTRMLSTACRQAGTRMLHSRLLHRPKLVGRAANTPHRAPKACADGDMARANESHALRNVLRMGQCSRTPCPPSRVLHLCSAAYCERTVL